MMIDQYSMDIRIEGLVQGVGFRPFLYRLAQEFGLKGSVKNSLKGVIVKATGERDLLFRFFDQISSRPPQNARIEKISLRWSAPDNSTYFAIEQSEIQSDDQSVFMPPDVNICAHCRFELFDPGNRRHLYPFITCADCGPRFTILRDLPFDRRSTSMADFPLCSHCYSEYFDPANRRFHAQTISCADCGPSLSVTDRLGNPLAGWVAKSSECLTIACQALLSGKVLAIKGIGGYQLVVLASHKQAVESLRIRKHRPQKPLAVMVDDLASAHKLGIFSLAETESLCSKEGAIVLVSKNPLCDLGHWVTFGLNTIGIMLPTSALHCLILHMVGEPLIVTSGNHRGDPIAIEENEALKNLSNIADLFLHNNRTIHHRADDSVVRHIALKQTILRLSRGFAPLYLQAPYSKDSMLAVGGHSKNCFAVKTNQDIVVSQHMGDLESYKNFNYSSYEIEQYFKILKTDDFKILHDCNPEYLSSHLAKAKALSLNCLGTKAIYHHKAHILSCALENKFTGRALGVAWDGLGLGENGEAWGGEFYHLDLPKKSINRVAAFWPFKLLGLDKAAREPRRCALGVAYEIAGKACLDYEFSKGFSSWVESFSVLELSVLEKQLVKAKGMTAETSSVGRIFDAISSFLNLKQRCTFEGQAAMLLEGIVDHSYPFQPYKIVLKESNGFMYLDWRDFVAEIFEDLRLRCKPSVIAARFHHTLVQSIELLIEKFHHETVILSGGVFQNKYLVEMISARLAKINVTVLRHSMLPPNDAGLAVGQIAYELFSME